MKLEEFDMLDEKVKDTIEAMAYEIATLRNPKAFDVSDTEVKSIIEEY